MDIVSSSIAIGTSNCCCLSITGGIGQCFLSTCGEQLPQYFPTAYLPMYKTKAESLESTASSYMIFVETVAAGNFTHRLKQNCAEVEDDLQTICYHQSLSGTDSVFSLGLRIS